MSDPGAAVTPLAARIRDARTELSLILELLGDDVAGAAEVVSEEHRRVTADLDAARLEINAERELRRLADRRAEMFRHALFVYLQERDGPAGANAPTPETLRLIRELLGVLDGVA